MTLIIANFMGWALEKHPTPEIQAINVEFV